MGALTHAIEAYVSTVASPCTPIWRRSARIREIVARLPKSHAGYQRDVSTCMTAQCPRWCCILPLALGNCSPMLTRPRCIPVITSVRWPANAMYPGQSHSGFNARDERKASPAMHSLLREPCTFRATPRRAGEACSEDMTRTTLSTIPQASRTTARVEPSPRLPSSTSSGVLRQRSRVLLACYRGRHSPTHASLPREEMQLLKCVYLIFPVEFLRSSL